jgi:catechol 2,3-dioxygenase-like lactoylglutathione lyase family enzyme
MIPMSIDHVAVVVPDMEAALDWYPKAFGWHLAWRETLTTVPAAWLYLPGEQVAIEGAIFFTGEGRPFFEVHQYRPSAIRTRQACDLGRSHVAVHVTDVPGTARHLVRLGATILGEPQVTTRGGLAGHTWVWMLDPWGNVLELRHHPSSAWRGDAIVDHPGLVVGPGQLESAVQWHMDTFGWEKRWEEDPTDIDGASLGHSQTVRLKGAILKTGNSNYEIHEFERPLSYATPRLTSDTGYGHIALYATDIDAEHRRLCDAGMTFAGEPREITSGALKGFRWVYGKDPFGNIIEITSHPPYRAEGA